MAASVSSEAGMARTRSLRRCTRRSRSIRHEQELRELLSGLLADAADAGAVRKDVSPDELASYCLHALAAASDTGTATATARLVSVVVHGSGTACGRMSPGPLAGQNGSVIQPLDLKPRHFLAEHEFWGWAWRCERRSPAGARNRRER